HRLEVDEARPTFVGRGGGKYLGPREVLWQILVVHESHQIDQIGQPGRSREPTNLIEEIGFAPTDQAKLQSGEPESEPQRSLDQRQDALALREPTDEHDRRPLRLLDRPWR